MSAGVCRHTYACMYAPSCVEGLHGHGEAVEVDVMEVRHESRDSKPDKHHDTDPLLLGLLEGVAAISNKTS